MALAGIGAGISERSWLSTFLEVPYWCPDSHSTCSNIRVGPHFETWQICCCAYLHYSPFLSKRSLGPVDCSARRMALVWTALWTMVSWVMPVDFEFWHVSRARLSLPSKTPAEYILIRWTGHLLDPSSPSFSTFHHLESTQLDSPASKL